MKIRTQVLLVCGCLLWAVVGVWCEQRGLFSASSRHGKYIVDENGRRIYGKVLATVKKSGCPTYVFFEDDDGIDYVPQLDEVKESPP